MIRNSRRRQYYIICFAQFVACTGGTLLLQGAYNVLYFILKLSVKALLKLCKLDHVKNYSVSFNNDLREPFAIREH